MSKKWTFTDKKERGLDFLRYLRTDSIELSGLTKQELRKFYVEEYRDYRFQFKPGEQQIPFSVILQTLFVIGRVHLRGIHLHSGPAPGRYFNSRKDEDSQEEDIVYSPSSNNIISSSSEGAQSSNFQTENSYRPRRRSRRGNRRVNNKIAVDQHITYNKPEPLVTVNNQGTPHRANVPSNFGATSVEFDPEFIKKIGHNYDCSICSAKCTSAPEMARHIEGRRHRMGILTHHMKKQRESYIKDKNSIQIHVNAEMKNGTVFIDLEENKLRLMQMKVVNTSEDELIELLHCELLKRIRVFQLDDERKVTESQDTVNILPGSSYIINVRAEARNVGSFNSPVAFHFRSSDDTEFHIIRFLNARCKNQLTEQLQPTKQYKRPPRVARNQETVEMVRGYRLPSLSSDTLEKAIKLPPFQIPDGTRRMINRGFKEIRSSTQAEKLELSSVRRMLENPITMAMYYRKFSTLMFVEEIQMEVDIRKYDMEAVALCKCPQNSRLLLLEVPGLAENRPSVLIGDHLYVRQNTKGKLGDKEYQGFVHEVRLKEVALGFHDSLMNFFVPNMKFNVRFVFNRLPLRLQHRACMLAGEESLEDILFPTQDNICTRGQRPIQNQRFYNADIERNAEQKKAVLNIVSGISRPAPYIVFGPPGTGKTVTIVESMKQIYHTQRDSHILACTPSNSAADLLTERLLTHVNNKGHLIRLNAMSRSWRGVPDKIKEYCNYSKMDRTYFYPPKAELMKYRIIVCTLITAGRIASANFPHGHFTHIFIDEAGHAVEPEALIPVAGVLNCDSPLSCGQLVLAGDPKQLGPILRSPWAIKYGLDISLLERYMTHCPVYQRRGGKGQTPYDNRIITKLLKNYRSHPAILAHPNEVFYDNELKTCADIHCQSLCDWEKLPRKNFPLIFHGVSGQDMREERSPSFFNAEEATVVYRYVCSLLKEKKTGIRLTQKNIGIISPYRKQVQKIQSLLRRENWNDIQVGSVEEFQGQEKLVIIVSTVRSNPEYLSLDMQYKLGFLKNPKRFNVTVTRAIALMIVIGDPRTLSLDPHWKSFITYCQQNRAYIGTEFMPEDEEIDDIMERLNAVKLKTDNFTDASSTVAEVDSGEEDNITDDLIISASRFDEKPWRGDI